MLLTSQNAVIFAASGAIASQVARRLAAEGATVWLSARRAAPVKQLADEIAESGGQAPSPRTRRTRPRCSRGLPQHHRVGDPARHRLQRHRRRPGRTRLPGQLARPGPGHLPAADAHDRRLPVPHGQGGGQAHDRPRHRLDHHARGGPVDAEDPAHGRHLRGLRGDRGDDPVDGGRVRLNRDPDQLRARIRYARDSDDS